MAEADTISAQARDVARCRQNSPAFFIHLKGEGRAWQLARYTHKKRKNWKYLSRQTQYLYVCLSVCLSVRIHVWVYMYIYILYILLVDLLVDIYIYSKHRHKPRQILYHGVLTLPARIATAACRVQNSTRLSASPSAARS